MKKLFLFALIFAGMFFINTEDTYALDNEEQINAKYLLACSYELIDEENKNPAYAHIYYNQSNGGLMIKTTKYNGKNIEKEFKNPSKAPIYGSAKNNLEINNFKCPTNAYYNMNSEQICFDNNDEACMKENKNNINEAFQFDKWTTSSMTDNSYKIGLINSGVSMNCDKTIYQNECVYTNEDGENLALYYNIKGNALVFYGKKNTTAWSNKYIILLTDTAHFYEGQVADLSYKNNIGLVNSCPKNIYKSHDTISIDGKYKAVNNIFSAQKPDKTDYSKYELRTACLNKEEEPGEQTPDDCKIITTELQDYINDIMLILRIGIPILLIGLLIYDFATAVFAGADDKIKKAQSKAIKRVIIAIAIFFVPTLINFVFNIVNEVWGKELETCGLSSEKIED